jgi:hypothetical protein
VQKHSKHSLYTEQADGCCEMCTGLIDILLGFRAIYANSELDQFTTALPRSPSDSRPTNDEQRDIGDLAGTGELQPRPDRGHASHYRQGGWIKKLKEL